MSRLGRIRSEFGAGWRAFGRRRTAVFFTFFFPVIIVAIFGALVQTQPTGGGIFAEPPAYYVPGYLAVVVLFTPLSRIGSEIARHRDGNRFEKLATTPERRWEWQLAHTLVNVVVIGIAALGLFVLTLLVTGAAITLSPWLGLLVPFVALAVALFCGLGSILGRVADSQDGVIAASNAIALPLLFLSETFVPLDMLPAWFRPLVNLSPLTYFARGVRSLVFAPAGVPAGGEPGAGGGAAAGAAAASAPDPAVALTNLGILAVLALAFFVAGAYAIPRTD